MSAGLVGFDVSVTDYGDAARVTARGELDVDTAPRLHAALSEVEAPGRHVTVDLRALTFIDSSGINLLTDHAARAGPEHFTLSIFPPGPPAARALDVAGVRDVLPLVDAGARPPPHRSGPVTGPLGVWVDDTPPVVRIRLSGELDLGTVPRLRQEVDGRARAGQTMILDLRELEFVDSMGLAALVRAQHRARGRGARLQLIAGRPAVHAVFVLTGLHAIFDWVPAGEEQSS